MTDGRSWNDGWKGLGQDGDLTPTVKALSDQRAFLDPPEADDDTRTGRAYAIRPYGTRGCGRGGHGTPCPYEDGFCASLDSCLRRNEQYRERRRNEQ